MNTPVPDWDSLAAATPQLTATMRRYLDQLAVSLTAESVRNYDSALRQFAGFLMAYDPALDAVACIDRYHLEAYKRQLSTRRTHHDAVLSKHTVGQRLKTLRLFFDRIIEWGYHDAPARNPVFHGDIPPRDQPLPRFLDDPTATKFMRALADEPDPFRRLTIEILARTGVRVGELCRLQADAVVQIGDAHWLRVPVGKLHNDRYVPLHPNIVALLADWQATHPPQPGSLLLSHQRPLTRDRVARMLGHIAKRAGIPRPTPHQLRHTLATQAINRGMRLEAIAALLGHRSLEMTMVYARIADRTVADEYQAVSAKVDALYAHPPALPANAEGANMRRLRGDLHHRMLGNGYCTRPAELDCQFESICETCVFFQTTIEFAPTLARQRDHATQRGQHHRVNLFTRLLDDASDAKPA